MENFKDLQEKFKDFRDKSGALSVLLSLQFDWIYGGNTLSSFEYRDRIEELEEELRVLENEIKEITG